MPRTFTGLRRRRCAPKRRTRRWLLRATNGLALRRRRLPPKKFRLRPRERRFLDLLIGVTPFRRGLPLSTVSSPELGRRRARAARRLRRRETLCGFAIRRRRTIGIKTHSNKNPPRRFRARRIGRGTALLLLRSSPLGLLERT